MLMSNALNSMCRVLDEECERYTATHEMKPVDDKKSFGYIPVKAFDFMIPAQYAFDHWKDIHPEPNQIPTFVDAGCGPGWTLKMATAIGYEAYGVENNPKHVKFGDTQGLEIIAGDITKFDFTDYDVFYAYVPLLGPLFGPWTEKILTAAKPGTIFIAADRSWKWVYPQGQNFETIYSGEKHGVKGYVFKKL